jgi:hypothetical protein
MEQVMLTKYKFKEKQPEDSQNCLIGFDGFLEIACYRADSNQFVVFGDANNQYYKTEGVEWAPLDFEPLEQTHAAAQQRQAIIDKATIDYVAAMCANRNLNTPAAAAINEAIVLAKLTADALGYAELPTGEVESE